VNLSLPPKYGSRDRLVLLGGRIATRVSVAAALHDYLDRTTYADEQSR
jgi:hypothetical protein